MSLVLGDNFSYQGAKPLDARLKYDTMANMKAVADATMYDGCLAYCVATDKTYQWKSTNTVDVDTGKWREFTSGDSLPLGGTTGQALVKHSNTDKDVEWSTVDSIPNGGTTGQALVKHSNTDKDVEWATIEGQIVQIDTLPTAAQSNLGKIYEYTGATGTYTNGLFYQCVFDGTNYSWAVVDVVDTLTASDVTDIKNAFAVQTYVDRGITIDVRGTEIVVGEYVDANGDYHKLYQKTVATSGSVPSGATLVYREVMENYDTILYTK